MKLRTIMLILLVISPILMFNCSTPKRRLPSWLAARMEAGERPDVGYVDVMQIPAFIKQGWLTPLPDNFELDKEDFQPVLLDYFQYEGQLYAVPFDFQPITLLVNDAMFDKYGLDVPTTWDDLRKAAEVIQEGEADNEGFYAVGLTAGLWNWLPFLYQAGGSLFDESGSRLALNTDQAQEAFTFYTALAGDGLAFVGAGDEWPYWGAYGDEGVINRFIEGKTAMCFGGPGIYNSLREAGVPVRAVEPPEGPAGKATIALVRGYGLFSDRPTAVELLQFLSHPDQMKVWIGDSQSPSPPDYLPVRRSLQDSWLAVHPDTEAFIRSADYIAPAPVMPLVDFDAVVQLDKVAAQKIGVALHGEILAEEALSQLKAEGDQILAEGQQ